jgi:hypothetical protein
MERNQGGQGMSDTVKKVYKAIVAVSLDISKTGIAKNRSNVQQGYKFRGIDDVYNEVAPLLSKHGLCILPRVLARNVIERQTAKGGMLYYVTVEMEFDFVCAEDCSVHTVKTFGEAMDSGDKATNKAMSAAYKYAALQVFCIPTEGDNDADAGTATVDPPVDLDKDIIGKIGAASTVDDLAVVWNAIPVGNRRAYSAAKDEAKARIGKAAE